MPRRSPASASPACWPTSATTSAPARPWCSSIPTLLEAQLAQAQAQAAQAEDQARRVAGLDNQGVVSQEQIAQRRFQAQVARANLRDLQARMRKMAVVAPVSGLILERTVRPGDLSAGGTTPWFRMARDGQVELSAQLSEERPRPHPPRPERPGHPAQRPGYVYRPRAHREPADQRPDQARRGARQPAGAQPTSAPAASPARCSPTSAAWSWPVPETAVRYDASRRQRDGGRRPTTA
jgi:HlyD family secretion protein